MGEVRKYTEYIGAHEVARNKQNGHTTMTKLIQAITTAGTLALAAVPLLVASTSAYAAAFIG